MTPEPMAPLIAIKAADGTIVVRHSDDISASKGKEKGQ
jgi:hypothetical protein